MAIQDPSVTSKRQRSKEYKSRPFFRLLFNRKEPEEGSGAASTYHRKNIFSNFLTLQLFVPKNKRLGGLHSMSAIFAKLHSLHSKEKEPRGHQAKVHISQKKNQRRPSQDFTSRKTRIKTTTTRPLKLNHEMLGGLSMGNPTGPP